MEPEAASGSDATVAKPTDANSEAGWADATSAEVGSAEATALEAASDAPQSAMLAYAGGYTGEILTLSVDGKTGALTAIGQTTSFGSAPSFLAVDPTANRLYAVDEASSGRVGAYAMGSAGALRFLVAVASGGGSPSFVSVDRSGNFALVANYDSGTVSVLPILTGGGLGQAMQTLSVGAAAHMIVTDPSNRFAFVPCKLADFIAQFTFDATSGTLTPNAVANVPTAAGAGPRHLAFHPNGHFVYVINETNSTMSAYALDATSGVLTEIQTLSTLPATGFTGMTIGGEVWVHPSGAWLLGSNRGHDSIVVFGLDAATGKMTLHGFTPCGGDDPRDFTFDPTGTLLYVANRTAGTIVSFRFDPVSGSLTSLGSPISFPMVSFIGLARSG